MKAGASISGAVMFLLLGVRPAAAPAPIGGPGRIVTVRITIHHSAFSPRHLRVADGSLVAFHVTNTDPIDHELIVGDQATQDRVERGDEPDHHARGQVSVAAGASASTYYVFGGQRWWQFGCHLPGHWAYGMRGTIEVARR
ncbi:MAG TPA: plastocyanin/azurin family copper-binding protein [Acidimicrobiales bacterium]